METNPNNLHTSDNSFQLGISAIKKEMYRDAIKIFKSVRKHCNKETEKAEADRFIGVAYSRLKTGIRLLNFLKARRYLRRAARMGMVINVSLISLIDGEKGRPPFFKWLRESYLDEKIDELYDWLLTTDPLNDIFIQIVAAKAAERGNWHKAAILYDRLIYLDKKNVNQNIFASRALAYYWLGDPIRALFEYNKLEASGSMQDELNVQRGKLNFIFGNFDLSNKYFTSLSKPKKDKLLFVLHPLELCLEANNVSENLHDIVSPLLLNWYHYETLLSKINEIENLSDLFTAISKYQKYNEQHFNIDLNPIVKEAKEKAFEFNQQLYPSINQNKNLTQGMRDFDTTNSNIEDYLDFQGKQIQLFEHALDDYDLFKLLQNIILIESHAKQTKKSQRFLVNRLLFIKILLISIKALLFVPPAIILIDGLIGVFGGSNLLFLILPSIGNVAQFPYFSLLIGLSWFLTLLFIDEVIQERLEKILTKSFREKVTDYLAMITMSLVSGFCAKIILKASLPVPNRDMRTVELIRIGIDKEKLWGNRALSLIYAALKAKPSELIGYQESLYEMLDTEDEKVKSALARLLGISGDHRILPVLESLLNKKGELLFLILNAIAQIGTQEALERIKSYAITNLADNSTHHYVIGSLKFAPAEYAIPIVFDLIKSCFENKIRAHDYIAALEDYDLDKNISSVEKIINLANDMHIEFDLISSITRTKSQKTIESIIGTISTKDDLWFDLLTNSLDAKKDYKFLNTLLSSEKLSISKKKIILKQTAPGFKEEIEDLAFQYWKNEITSDFLFVLGCIETERSLAYLNDLLNQKESENIKWHLVGKKDIIVALAISGEKGKDHLIRLSKKDECAINIKLFSICSLIAVSKYNEEYLELAKRYLSDSQTNINLQEDAISLITQTVLWNNMKAKSISNVHIRTQPGVVELHKWIGEHAGFNEEIRSMSNENLTKLLELDMDMGKYHFAKIVDISY